MEQNQEVNPVFIFYEYALDIKNGALGDSYIFCIEEEKFYKYSDGVWCPTHEKEFLRTIELKMPHVLKYPLPARQQIIENYKTIGLKNIKHFNWSCLLNVRNGMLNPYDGSICEHLDSYYSTFRLPCNYDQHAKSKLWEKTIDKVLEGDRDKIESLQEFYGYCLTNETKYERFLILEGEPRCGKSTIMLGLEYVIGKAGCSGVSIKELANPQYTPMLVNKFVNIDPDVDSKATGFISVVKKIASGESIPYGQKYVENMMFNPYCKMIFGSNDFPRITDKNDAFYERMMLIPCGKKLSITERNVNLKEQLKDELPGILNWCIEGLKRLTARGNFEIKPFMEASLIAMEDANNPVNEFFDEHVEVLMGAEVTKGALFAKYKIWVEDNGYRCMSSANFSQSLFAKYSNHTFKHTNDGKKRTWQNIKYVDFKENQPTEQKEMGWEQ